MFQNDCMLLKRMKNYITICTLHVNLRYHYHAEIIFFFSKKGDVFCVKSILRSMHNELKVFVVRLQVLKSFFDYPCESEMFSMYEVNDPSENQNHSLFAIEDIACKALIMPSANLKNVVVTPLLHCCY